MVHKTSLRQIKVSGRISGHDLSFANIPRITEMISVIEKRSGNENPNKNVKARDDLFPIYTPSNHWNSNKSVSC